jgi:hypothetical protein
MCLHKAAFLSLMAVVHAHGPIVTATKPVVYKGSSCMFLHTQPCLCKQQHCPTDLSRQKLLPGMPFGSATSECCGYSWHALHTKTKAATASCSVALALASTNSTM